jgi:hypothetical protein
MDGTVLCPPVLPLDYRQAAMEAPASDKPMPVGGAQPAKRAQFIAL